MKLISLGLRFVVPLLLGYPALAQGQLWIVDAAAGPGYDFTGLQAAIDFAADGDTILVRTGAYGDNTIDGKALVVAEEPGDSVKMTSIAVRNLQSHEKVVLRGIASDRWTLEANQGPVWLESVDGGSASPLSCILGTGPGSAHKLTISDCADVVIIRSSFLGGASYSTLASFDGIHATNSNLTLFETRAGGGMLQDHGVDGGDGLDITDCTLFASGCEFVGGCGAQGDLCDAGGDGGAGLRRVGGAEPQLLECELAGGNGGCAAEYPLCPYCGAPGSASTASYALIAGFARDYAIASPGTGGGTTTLAYSGKPGDLVFSLISLGQDSLFLPELAGTLVLPIMPILISHGPASGSGTLGVSVPLPTLPPGIEAFTVYAQAAAISGVGAAVLGAPSQLTIL